MIFLIHYVFMMQHDDESNYPKSASNNLKIENVNEALFLNISIFV